LKEFIRHLLIFFPKYIKSIDVFSGSELNITLKGKSYNIFFLRVLREFSIFSFRNFIGIHGVDYPKDTKERFMVVYNLLSIDHNIRVRVSVRVGENNSIFSCCNIFAGSSWYERELWDLFGIYFIYNLDLRRILTDYGFEGHPLRKDFPLTGYIEVRYDDTYKCIVYEPVELTQEYRTFEFTSPWLYTSITKNSII